MSDENDLDPKVGHQVDCQYELNENREYFDEALHEYSHIDIVQISIHTVPECLILDSLLLFETYDHIDHRLAVLIAYVLNNVHDPEGFDQPQTSKAFMIEHENAMRQ